MAALPRRPPGEGSVFPSGRQATICAGETVATITEVGAGLRQLQVSGEDILYGYPAKALCSGGRGQVLMPWPNRLEDGEYEFEGVLASAALDEPSAGNAIHGLARWVRWNLELQSGDEVRAACDLPAQPGYPFSMRLSLRYRVVSGGLVVRAEATNVGERCGPFGAGFHPYLNAGTAGLDACRLTVPAATHLVADRRGIPCGREPVHGGRYDFRSARVIGEKRLDDCFCDLPPDGWVVELERPDGWTIELFGDAAFGYVMCYSGDTLEMTDRRRALAVEPMSCPANAFRSGESLVVLQPGESWTGEWGIRASRL